MTLILLYFPFPDKEPEQVLRSLVSVFLQNKPVFTEFWVSKSRREIGNHIWQDFILYESLWCYIKKLLERLLWRENEDAGAQTDQLFPPFLLFSQARDAYPCKLLFGWNFQNYYSFNVNEKHKIWNLSHDAKVRCQFIL